MRHERRWNDRVTIGAQRIGRRVGEIPVEIVRPVGDDDMRALCLGVCAGARDPALGIAVHYDETLPSQRASRPGATELPNVVAAVAASADDDDRAVIVAHLASRRRSKIVLFGGSYSSTACGDQCLSVGHDAHHRPTACRP